MKEVLTLVFSILWSLVAINSSAYANEDVDGRQILNKSIKVHDPEGKWNTAKIKIHIQEPRLKNVHRFSRIMLDNATGAFQMERNREDKVTTHVIDKEGKSKSLLDGKAENDPALISRYRLEAARNFRYKQFSYVMLGLPMSLEGDAIKSFGDVSRVNFNSHESYKIPVTLSESLFSENWTLYIREDTFGLIGLEINFPDDATKGERLYFDKEIDVSGLRIPRIRHWHEYKDDSYSGSDILMEILD